MKIFNTNQPHAAHGLKGPHSNKPNTATGPTQKPDQLDISSEAQKASKLAELLDSQSLETRALEGLKPADGSIRTDLVDRLRSEIASGAYESPDKIDAALDRLIDQLG